MTREQMYERIRGYKFNNGEILIEGMPIPEFLAQFKDPTRVEAAIKHALQEMRRGIVAEIASIRLSRVIKEERERERSGAPPEPVHNVGPYKSHMVPETVLSRAKKAFALHMGGVFFLTNGKEVLEVPALVV